ncbi:hypothetical protein TSUD_163950 [Trifolium subterraneum]|uniref:Uncharacterized protein n=1 Tax=Trifolium subterraneum TaxID=3900 RepID=A0A2Z6NQ69_TRISU|nr:hypothetical protein TSUD_163950 [Trifolium subterraneum]
MCGLGIQNLVSYFGGCFRCQGLFLNESRWCWRLSRRHTLFEWESAMELELMIVILTGISPVDSRPNEKKVVDELKAFTAAVWQQFHHRAKGGGKAFDITGRGKTKQP